MAGGHGGGGTPGPIPNPEVKPPSADGTAGQPVGEQGAAGHEGALSFRSNSSNFQTPAVRAAGVSSYERHANGQAHLCGYGRDVPLAG